MLGPYEDWYRDVEWTIPLKTFEDKLVGPNISITEENDSHYFSGITSVKNDEQLLDLTGVTWQFQFLIKKIRSSKSRKSSNFERKSTFHVFSKN